MIPVPVTEEQRTTLERLARLKGMGKSEAALGQLAAEILAETLLDRWQLAATVARARRAAEQSRG